MEKIPEKELEEKIADLKKRMPAHSIPPSMVQELEKLETRLRELRKKQKETE